MITIVDTETARKLKKIGYPQLESAYYWVARPTAWGKDYIRMSKADVMFDVYEYFAAPDGLELGWHLLDRVSHCRTNEDLLGCFGAYKYAEHHTLKDMADMWIELKRTEVTEVE